MNDALRRLIVVSTAAMAALTALLSAPLSATAADAMALSAARNSITAAELIKHAETLADDTFEGREAGSRGGRAAAGYLVKLLEQHGLQPAGEDGSYFQGFGTASRNILARLEGSDPELKQEVILIGAHYDHVGYGNSTNSYGPIGYIHNGADDNASGVAGLLELIDAFGKLPEPPRRTLLFAFWDGEEKGLLGSQHWAAHPTIPVSRIRAAINLDMIGRLRKQRLEVFGTRTAGGLRSMISRQNNDADLALDFSWKMASDSDHYTFYSRNIPTLMLHTGLHDDYHRPSDDADKLNVEGMQEVSRLLFNIVVTLADAPVLPKFRTDARRESEFTQLQFEQPLASLPPRLGVRWNRPPEGADAPQRGLELIQVTPGAAAARAGLRVGDRLLRLGDRDITDQEQFITDVVTATSPITLTVERAGEEQPLELEVPLDGQPVRLGINWRVDPADEGVVMLTRVVPGSPAARAGLAVRDRIYAVAGQPIGDVAGLTERLTTLPSPIEMLIERNGKLQEIELDVPPARTQGTEAE